MNKGVLVSKKPRIENFNEVILNLSDNNFAWHFKEKIEDRHFIFYILLFLQKSVMLLKNDDDILL